MNQDQSLQTRDGELGGIKYNQKKKKSNTANIWHDNNS